MHYNRACMIPPSLAPPFFDQDMILSRDLETFCCIACTWALDVASSIMQVHSAPLIPYKYHSLTIQNNVRQRVSMDDIHILFTRQQC